MEQVLAQINSDIQKAEDMISYYEIKILRAKKILEQGPNAEAQALLDKYTPYFNDEVRTLKSLKAEAALWE